MASTSPGSNKPTPPRSKRQGENSSPNKSVPSFDTPAKPGAFPGRAVAAAFACQITLLCLAGWQNDYMLNTDGFAYLRIASYYAHGQTHLMISGYWGPLISWLMAPLLALGVPPLVTGRVVMGLSAVIFWFGCISVFRSFRIPSWGVIAGAWLAAFVSIWWSVENIAPDLLLAGLICLAVAQMVSPAWLENWRTAAFAGALWSAAYFAKAVAFPLALITSLVFAAIWSVDNNKNRRRVLSSLAITILVFLFMATPWLSVLSMKYHKLTFSTTAAIAHAVVGPPDVDRYHPFGRTFHRPEPGRLTSWEDPSVMKYNYWSPFANKEYATHQLKLIARNFQTIVRLLWGFDLIGIGLLALLGCLAVPSLWREKLAQERWRWAIVPVVCLSGIYLPVYIQKVDGRYFYAAYPFLWVAVVGATGQLTARISRDWLRKAIVALVLVSFAVGPAMRAVAAVEGIQDPASIFAQMLANKLKAAGIQGPIAGSAMIAGGRTGLYVAFLLNEPWYGDEPNPTTTSFKKSGAKLILLRRQSKVLAELAGDSAFRDLDERLFSSAQEANEFPLKVYEASTPGNGR